MVPPSALRVVEILAAHPGVERVRLFGSRARGDHDACSDVDLAVDAPTLGHDDRVRLSLDADEARTLYPVDVVWTDDAPAALRAQIDADGVTLYGREHAAAAR